MSYVVESRLGHDSWEIHWSLGNERVVANMLLENKCCCVELQQLFGRAEIYANQFLRQALC